MCRAGPRPLPCSDFPTTGDGSDGGHPEEARHDGPNGGREEAGGQDDHCHGEEGPAAKATTATAKKAPAAKKPAAKAPAKKARGEGAATKKPAAKAPAKEPAKKSPFTPAFVEKQRKALEEERAKFLRQAIDKQMEADQLVADREPGDVQFDEESGEGDSIAVERSAISPCRPRPTTPCSRSTRPCPHRRRHLRGLHRVRRGHPQGPPGVHPLGGRAGRVESGEAR